MRSVGPQLARGERAADLDSFGEVVLAGRLREAIGRVHWLPLGLIELKNGQWRRDDLERPTRRCRPIRRRFRRCCTTTPALVLPDGLQARIGSLTANQVWFKVWRTIDGQHDGAPGTLELETLVRGVFERQWSE
jgi:type I restriction enzyme R subunit